MEEEKIQRHIRSSSYTWDIEQKRQKKAEIERNKKLEAKKIMIAEMRTEKEMPVKKIAEHFGVSTQAITFFCKTYFPGIKFPRYHSERVERVFFPCFFCGKESRCLPCSKKNSKNKFCNRECQIKNRQKNARIPLLGKTPELIRE